KTAQLALARGLAETTVGTGVTVNSVLPGPTRSEGVGQFIADLARGQGKSAAEVETEFFRTARPSSLLQRFATPEEVASMVAYVCSRVGRATKGAALGVDGGVVRWVIGAAERCRSAARCVRVRGSTATRSGSSAG